MEVCSTIARIAYHEAAHAVVGYELGWHLHHGGVCISPDAGARASG
jgi:hypothetical protein